MKKRIISLLVTIALMLSTLPLSQVFAIEEKEAETKNFLTKTANWTDADKDEVKISLESSNASESLAENILFLGSLCGNHSLTEETVIDSLNTAVGKANVDYRLWYSPKGTITDDPDLGASKGDRELFSGSLEKGSKITDKSKLYSDLKALTKIRTDGDELGDGAHNSLYDFAYSLVEASKAEKTYDFIIMEFDGMLLGGYNNGFVDADSTPAKNLTAASKFIADFYKEGRVAWIIPQLDPQSADNFMFYDSKLNIPKTGSDHSENNRNAIKLLAPEDLNPDGSIPSAPEGDVYNGTKQDGSGNYLVFNTFKKRMKAAEDSEERIWVTYENNKKVSTFLEKKLAGDKYETVIITDTIKKGFKLKDNGVSAKYKAKTTSDTWSDVNADSGPKFTYKTSKNDLGEDVIVGTFTGVSTLGHTLVKMEIIATLDEANNPFPETSVNDTESADTNDGPATAEYIPGDPKKPTVKSTATAQPVTKNYYTVTTSVTNGTITEIKKYVEGSSPKITYSPDKYYELDYIKVNDVSLSAQDLKTNESYYVFDSIAKDEKIEVVYKHSKVTVTFDPDNGDKTFDEVIDKGTAVTKPKDDPEKSGYSFQCWKDEDGNEWKFDTLIEEDTKLIADYEINKYRVDFDNNGHGDTAPDAKTGIEHGSKIKAPTEPTDSNYEFLGWYTDKTDGTKFDFGNTEIVENKTLYAHWKEKTVTYNYYIGNGFGTVNGKNIDSETVPVITGSPQGAIATPATGYDFDNWTDSTGATVPADATLTHIRKSNTDPWQGGSYYANFKKHIYDVTFEMNGHGTQVSAQQVEYQANATKPDPKPSEIGWEFGGWYKDDGLTQTFDFATEQITKDTTIYAKWTEKQVRITYKVNPPGGKVDLDGQSGMTKYEDIKSVSGTPKGATAVANPGYTFKNWTNEEKTVIYSTDAKYVPKKDEADNTYKAATYCANFLINVDFVTNGHGTVPTQTVENNAKASKPVISDDGYELVGWYDNEGLEGEPFDFDSSIYEPKTLYAKWKVIVNFVEPKGPNTPTDAEKHDIGDVVNERDNEPEGYELGGWFEDPECTKPFDFEKEVTEPITLYPKWIEKAATLTYELDGGKFDQSDDSQKMLYSKQANIVKESPFKSGFIFKGYAKSAEDAKNGIVTYAASDLYKAANVVPADATLYAVWEEIPLSPKTGDSNRIILWMAFALMMVAAFFSTVLIKKKIR